jgi:hypothetical protein
LRVLQENIPAVKRKEVSDKRIQTTVNSFIHSFCLFAFLPNTLIIYKYFNGWRGDL